jgi:hypothetical protein
MGSWFFPLVVIVLLVLSVGGQVAHLHYAQIGRDAIAAVDHIDVLASATDNMAFEGVGAYCATIFMTATKQSMWRPIRKRPCSKESTQRRKQSTRTFRDFFCLDDSWRARQNIRINHHQQQMLPTAGRQPFFFSTRRGAASCPCTAPHSCRGRKTKSTGILSSHIHNTPRESSPPRVPRAKWPRRWPDRHSRHS